ncbi:MAG TPA: cell division protein FtsA [Ktedonobacterales bacterium]|jgi:cell division protein FtsA
MTDQIIAGIDVGTTKVAVLVAALDADGELTLLGGAQAPMRGMRRGNVVNLDETAAAVNAALERAERLCGHRILSAYVGLGGGHLEAENTRGASAINPGGREITYQDVARAIESARTGVSLAENRELIHQLPRGYVVDGQDGVTNPIGMSGFKLEVETHVVTGGVTTIQNLEKVLRQAQVAVEDLVAVPLVSAAAVITPAEREMGAMVVDIGGGTTSVAIFADGFPWYTAVLPGGGGAITHGIAAGLRLPLDVAERLKVEHGHCDPNQVAEDELIELGEESLVIPRAELARIIQDRARDLVAHLRAPLVHAQREDRQPWGVVLTGGSAQLPGLAELTARMLNLPSRVGRPAGLRGLADVVSDPGFATAAGLLLWGAGHGEGRGAAAGGGRGPRLGPLATRVRRLFDSLLP